MADAGEAPGRGEKFRTLEALVRDGRIHDTAMIAAELNAEGGRTEEQFVEVAARYVSYARSYKPSPDAEVGRPKGDARYHNLLDTTARMMARLPAT